jgi:3-oxoacyl-[acyl-carrier protein] reductase
MDTGIAGRRALVLGASKGIGFGIAQALAGDGVVVALTSRQLGSARQAAERIGPGVRGFACDTGDLAQVDALFAGAMEALGGIDILVLNGGGPTPGSARNVSPDVWRQAFDAMFVHLVRLADLCLPGMIEQRFGRIISVISSGVIEPIPNLAISNAIRPALVGWGKTLAGEVAASGVTVNAIAPGRILTDRLSDLDEANARRTGQTIEEVRTAAKARIPAGRYGTVEEFGAAALFLASAGASFITGSVIRVDGGQIASSL